MRAVLLVAAREMRQVLATRGFWVTLLIVPVAIAGALFASTHFAPHLNAAFTLVDASRRYAPRIEKRLTLDYQRDVLRDLSAYVDRWKLASVDPGAAWAQHDAWPPDAEVERFIAAGGVDAALRRLKPRLPADAPAFELPEQAFVEIAPPRGVPTTQGPEAFGRAVAAPMRGEIATPDGKRPFTVAVYIPQNFGEPGVPVRIWTNGRFNEGLIGTIREQLTTALRQNALQGAGLSPDVATRIQTLSAPIQVSEPPADARRSVIVTRSIIPLALVYLLLITTFTTGSLMLQGMIEERSNKLLESVLATIRPSALMYGKLLGLGAVGLLIVVVWSGCAVAGVLSSHNAISDVLRSSLQALDQPWIAPALIFYFLSGYVMVSMLFLTIGSVSDSMQDAQGYLMPVIILIMLPVVVLMQVSLRTPDSPVMHVLSWIPLYTPFAMLSRLGQGVPLAEMLGTGAMLIVFVALELALLGRVFQASLLSTGQPPNPAAFLKLMFQRDSASRSPRGK
ncbi:MAG TPA: ABC transporter permease [Caulobacteraceae bacterium]|jgi:ABC-2 type transport system permease protein